MDELLTVGQVARLCGLTTKALRHYDRIGLLVPAQVDPVNGYRLYAPDQVALARLVGVLRSVDVPLEDVRTALAAPHDEDALRGLLVAHRRRMRARLDRVRGDVHRLDHLIDDGTGALMTSTDTAPTAATPDDERRLAVDLFNGV